MKYYNLHIGFEPSWQTYNKITRILNTQPNEHEKSRFDSSEEPSDWWMQLVDDDDGSPIDFINIFLDMLDPNFAALAELGIERNDILIWLMYEYQLQCAMSFTPQEMERLGKTGITLNIDCFEYKSK